MARNTAANRLTAGTAFVVALSVLVGTALVAGPALAQETTEDGMDGNETMTDGNETMDDGMGENESMADDGSMDDGNETMTDDGTMGDGNESMGDDEMAGDDESMDDDEMETGTMDDEEMTDDETMDEGDMDEETATGGQPGFGVVVTAAALIAGAAFVRYRRRG